MNMSDLQPADWHTVCSHRDLVPDSGVVALVAGEQVALFYLPKVHGQQIYAVENRDPRSGANVIGRGIVGLCGGALVVASPLYKQHFRLEDGICLEDPAQRLRIWPARLDDQAVQIAVPAMQDRHATHSFK